MRAEGVTVLDNWRAMGMRASGSNDVVLDQVFVPDEAVSLRRPQGRWHAFYNVALPIAWPMIMSVYVEVAEAARDLAVQSAQRKLDDSDIWYLMGELDNALVTPQIAVDSMLDVCANLAFVPEVATVNATFIRKTIAAQAVLSAAEKAAEAVGGVCFGAPLWSACCVMCTRRNFIHSSPNVSTALRDAWLSGKCWAPRRPRSLVVEVETGVRHLRNGDGFCDLLTDQRSRMRWPQ